MRQVFLLILFTMLSTVLFAQDEFTGRVYENKVNVFLQGVRVEDLKSHAMTITGPDGSFTIKAMVGDLVAFTNSSYKPDTVFLANLKYMQIFLGVLGSHVVKYQRDDSGNYKGGVTFRIPDGSDSKRKHEEKVTQKERQQEKIRKVFNADSLKRYLPITGQEMQNFVTMYIPDIDTYFSFDFNLVAYLNRCYREFLKIPEIKVIDRTSSSEKLNSKDLHDLQKIFVDLGVMLASLVERRISDFVMNKADHFIATASHQCFDCCYPDTACQNTIHTRRTATTLDVPKD
jgi:hypothetical protein